MVIKNKGKYSIFTLLTAGISSEVSARGGVSGESGALIGIIILIGIGGLGVWVHKAFPNFFPNIGGLIVLLMVSQFLAVILASIGVIPDAYIFHAMLVTALLIIFSPAVWSTFRSKF